VAKKLLRQGGCVEGNMTSGTWQQIVFIDLDSRPRNRTIVFKSWGRSTNYGDTSDHRLDSRSGRLRHRIEVTAHNCHKCSYLDSGGHDFIPED